MNDKKITVTIVGEVDDDEVKALEDILGNIDGEGVGIQVDVEDGELNDAEEKVDDLDGREVEIQLGMENFNQGLDRMKQGVGELKSQMDEALAGAGKRETNETFLRMSIGAENASKQMENISKVVQELPGDDTAIQGLLSSAAAKNASMSADSMREMGTAAADYFSAMAYYGKSASESQQDMTNYLLAGNTAELERSPILQGHIDKLKDANTLEERSKALQEALNEEGWLGMSTQDTYNNKLETFNGMLQRGQDNFGKLFMEGSKGAMDFALKLDEATGGWVGMGIAAAQFASPLTSVIGGLGQMATGIKAITSLGIIEFLQNLQIMTRLSAVADYLLAGAQAVLNFVMSMNPIMIVVLALIALAAALVWAYYNVDWFREAVDNAWATVTAFAQGIINDITNAVNTVASVITGIGDAIEQEMQRAWDAVTGIGDKIRGAIEDMGLGMVLDLLNALGIGSPGYMFDMIEGEMNYMKGAVTGSGLESDISNLGEGMVSGFNPNLSTGNAGLGTGGNNITINIDNVDSEDRIQQIVQAVEDALKFDNLTAGRSV